jgi:hypothetical protein
MRRTILFAAVAVGFAVGGLMVEGLSRSSEAQTQTQIQVLEYPGPYFRFVDLGKPGVGAGDIRLQIWDLLDPVDESVVGDSVMKVTIVRSHHGGQFFTIILDCTVRLSDGDIAFHGVIRTDEFGPLPVVGGTGAYAGATGTVTIEPAEVAGQDGYVWTFDLIAG